MDLDVNSLEVKNNEAASRFEVALGDQVGMIEYRREDGVYEILHTEVPAEFGGKGIAERMAYGALEYIRAEGGKVIAYCPYVRMYIERHPEYQPLSISTD